MRILPLSAIGFLALLGCSKLASAVLESYSGNGTIVSDTRHVTPFHAVEFDGGYEVVLTQGPTTDVRIETDKNLLEHITTEVKDGKLVVESHGNLNPTKSITVYITSPDYTG